VVSPKTHRVFTYVFKMQKQILKIYPVKLFTRLNLFYSTRSPYLTGVFLSLAIFFAVPNFGKADVNTIIVDPANVIDCGTLNQAN